MLIKEEKHDFQVSIFTFFYHLILSSFFQEICSNYITRVHVHIHTHSLSFSFSFSLSTYTHTQVTLTYTSNIHMIENQG